MATSCSKHTSSSMFSFLPFRRLHYFVTFYILPLFIYMSVNLLFTIKGLIPTCSSPLPVFRTQYKANRAAKGFCYSTLRDLAMYGGGNDIYLDDLLRRGADVNLRLSDGLTLLSTASMWGQVTSVDLFIKAGADVNAVNNKGRTALMEAAENGRDKCVKLLIEAGADVNKTDMQGKHPLLFATMKDTPWALTCLDILMKAGADVNLKEADGSTVLFTASESGRVHLVDMFIKAGADVNAVNNKGQTALMQAVKNCRDTCMKLLVEAGIDVNKTDICGRHALMFAAESRHPWAVTCLDILIKTGANVNLKDSSGQTAVYGATRINARLLLSHLVVAGADVNVCDNNNETPLMTAVRYRNADCIYLLVIVGADMKLIKGAVGLMLHWRNVIFAEKFIKAGADVNLYDTSDHKGNVLAAAAKLDNKRIIKRLLHAGAHVNKTNRNTYNALETYVSSSDQMPVIKSICMFLLAAGERVNGTTLINNKGRSTKVPEYLFQRDISLKSWCRDVIRNHLLKLDPHINLFFRVPQLSLPWLLQRYMLFDLSLEEDD